MVFYYTEDEDLLHEADVYYYNIKTRKTGV